MAFKLKTGMLFLEKSLSSQCLDESNQIPIIHDASVLNHFNPMLLFIETSHLICTANQMSGFYMTCNTWLRKEESIREESSV